jgi:hypothetical protein
MSEYKGIKGFQVQTRTEDPTPYAQALADNPYAGSWAAGGTRNEARGALGGSIMGTQTANVAAGGNLSGSVSANAETYNGSSWTEGNNLNQARRSLMAAGLEPAGRVFGGDTSVNSTGFVATNESYNGTSFTEEADLNTGAGAGTGIGLTTAALAVGGSTGPGAPNYSNKVENWDGSSWTEVSEINTTRIRGGGAGITTAALFSGGQAAPGASNSVESWNGSSWTETTEINTARGYIGSAGASYTAALIYGGSPSRAITESWDGSSWTEVGDLATGQSDNFGIVNGTNLLALSSGGDTSPNALTEEWAFSGIDPSTTPAADYADAITGDFYYNSTTGQFKQVNTGGAPIGTWASGGAMNSAKRLQGGSGSSNTAALVFGGRQIPGTNVAETESYDGTSFTEVADLSRTNERAYIAGAGTQTAALAIGGAPPGVLGLTEQWNGSAWTEVADLNRGPAGPQSTAYGAGSGSSTSALYSSSDEAGNVNDRVESWDGSSWTEVSEVNTARSYGTQAGTDNTSAIFAGGYTTTNVANVETWDGSSWSETTDINTGRMRLSSGMQGSTESMLIFSGYTTDSVANTEDWNGSTWTEVNDMATARRSGTGSGVSTSAFQAGGQTGPSAPTVVANNEEFTANDFLIKTVTTS